LPSALPCGIHLVVGSNLEITESQGHFELAYLAEFDVPAEANVTTLAKMAKESHCVTEPVNVVGETYKCATASGLTSYFIVPSAKPSAKRRSALSNLRPIRSMVRRGGSAIGARGRFPRRPMCGESESSENCFGSARCFAPLWAHRPRDRSGDDQRSPCEVKGLDALAEKADRQQRGEHQHQIQ
jgi:hypothetical protein